jgi:2-methoxy-6-polyprenyl-1,4-benzoquinol methylase
VRDSECELRAKGEDQGLLKLKMAFIIPRTCTRTVMVMGKQCGNGRAIGVVGRTQSLLRYHSSSSSSSSSSSDAGFGTGGGGSETHFGFRTVPESEKARMVGDVFHSVANRYDLMNDLMSGGVHRVWKDCFVRKLDPVQGGTYLDVAGGTGDIAFRILDRIEANSKAGIYRRGAGKTAGNENGETKVIVADINNSMLEVGQSRSAQLGYQSKAFGLGATLDFVQADAEKLPIADGTVDAYTIAFGIRNCTHIDEVLKEAYRVLRPGGRFMCLEFSKVPYPGLRELYDLYSFNLIPTLGSLVAGDRDSYQYLVESIRQFPDQETFQFMIRKAGFRSVSYENYTFGVVAVHSGFKL